MDTLPKLYENPLKHTRRRSPSPRPQTNRIHSYNPSKRRVASPIISAGLSSTSLGKENILPDTGAKKFSSAYTVKPPASWPVGSARSSPPVRSPDEKSDCCPSTLAAPNSFSTDKKPLRSILRSSSSLPPHIKRRRVRSETEHKDILPSDLATAKDHQIREACTTRRAQGHKVPPRPHSARYIPGVPVTAQDFACHRREVHTVVSTLGSRIGALENTVAAALPVVAEARLLWMENAIVGSPAKLGTTRRAFCECYGNARYQTYARMIHARAYYLGLTMGDLEYLHERLNSLGFQSVKQETLLISPFGGASESGDKTMVEAYRWDSKHGAYARCVWRVCYESGYSVDEDWMRPVPIPDNLTLVEKVKGWLYRS